MTDIVTKRELESVIDHARDRIIATLPTKTELQETLLRVREIVTERTQFLHHENEAMAYVLKTLNEHQNSYNISLELRMKILERELARTQVVIHDLTHALHH
jgi:hypothetical protein